MDFTSLKRVLGLIQVTESGDQIHLTGLPGDMVHRDIAAIWGTSRFASQIFTHMGASDVSFNRWFAPDVLYMLNKVIEHGARKHNVRALERIVEQMHEHTWLKHTLEDKPDILDFNQLSKFHYNPLPHQDTFFKTYNFVVPRYLLHGYLLAAGPGTGKAQPLNAFIKTPGGWSTMGDMRVGTQVITPKGTTTTVTGVYPQGLKDIYRITFADGRKTEACGEHLWKVHLKNEHKTGYWKIKSTKEILESTSYQAGRAYVPLIDAEDSAALDLPVDPYLLGVLLGDGCISTYNSVVISNPDTFIKDKVQSRLDGDMCIGGLNAQIEYNLIGVPVAGQNPYNSLVQKLKALDLMGTHSHTKTIPEMYLMGSRQQRLDLLQGLMDTDGTADKSGATSYTTTSLELAEQVRYLVRSLGGLADMSVKDKHYTYKGERLMGRTAYQVNIRHQYPEELFSLPRKKERVRNDNQHAATLKLGIEKIELIGQQPAQCISVADEDHLYVTDGFVVTHNTYMGLALAEMLHADLVIMLTLKNAVHRVWYNSVRGSGNDAQDRLFKKEGIPCWTSLDGVPPPRRGCRHYVVHFDGMEKFADELQHLPHSKAVILLDESHNLNDDESFRAEQYFRICSITKSQHILHESGTPVKAVGGEVTTLFKAVDPMFDHDAEVRFKAIYGKSSGVANDILAARLGRMSFKVESRNVVKAQGHAHPRPIKLPNGEQYTLKTIREEMRTFVKERAQHYQDNMRHYERQYEDLLSHFERTLATSEQKKEYSRYRDYIKLIKKNYDPVVLKEQALFCNHYEKQVIVPTLSKEQKVAFKHVRSIVKYYKLKVQGEALGQILGKKRAQCVADMVPFVEWETYIDTAEKKTLVFTSYVTVVDAIVAHLKGKGYHSGVVYGDTSNELASIVSTFGRDPDMNPLVATYASLSTAVPITMANEMIMMNSPFRSYERDQAVARCVRQGQDRDVNIEDIFLDTGDEPNISTRSRDILAWSRQQVEEILDFKNPSFAMESHGAHRITVASPQEYWMAMEEFLEDVDGFRDIRDWSQAPAWAGGW